MRLNIMQFIFQYLFSLSMNERFNADGGYIGMYDFLFLKLALCRKTLWSTTVA